MGGQAFKFTGFVSEEGSFDSGQMTEDHVAIVTYWKSFEQHEESHADAKFKEKFDALQQYCSDAYEVGYEMMWQGTPED